MKKLLLLAALASVSIPSVSKQISRAEARQIAVETVGTISDSYDDAAAGDSAYYIFSKGPGNGYVIVSGDDATAPVIGITDRGDYDPASLPVQLREMLSFWKNRIETLQTTDRVQAPGLQRSTRLKTARMGANEYKADWHDVGPLVQTKWSQGYPYNLLAPLRDNGEHCLTGCVATAGAQVIYYFRKDNPDTLIYDTPTYSYGTPVTESLPAGTEIKYSYMRLEGGGTNNQNNAVATLMYAIGTSSWLTYGASTSGEMPKLGAAMRDQFNLDNTHLYKSGYSQSGWETAIYTSLKQGRPIAYAGANESSGGHAVVLDGYQASTGLFHFNFGWGGQSDGWYTVDDETGMNGFNTYQEMVTMVTPKKPNLKGRIIPSTIYQKAKNKVQAMITNNGTLDYSGLKLYVSSSTKKPSGTPEAQDAETVIFTGDSAIVSFEYSPTSVKTYHLFLTDDNGNLLDSCTAEVVPTVADIRVDSMSVDAEYEEAIENDGYLYGLIYNTSAVVTARMTNSADGTYCEPRLRCFLYSYDHSSQTWTRVSSKINYNVAFQPGETRDTTFIFNDLTPGVYYKAMLDSVARAGTNSPITFSEDSAVYFQVTEPTLAVAVDGRCATVTGRYNEHLFMSLTSPTVTYYDMTAVKGRLDAPDFDNPNTMIALDMKHLAALTGDMLYPGEQETLRRINGLLAHGNIIFVDKSGANSDFCPLLVIRDSYEYYCPKSFEADSARYIIEGMEAAKWYDAVIPFDAALPQGMAARYFTKVRSTSVATETGSSITRMTPMQLISDYADRNVIIATHAKIEADSTTNCLSGTITASTLATVADDATSVTGINDDDLPCYLPADEGTEIKPFATVLHKSVGISGLRIGNASSDRYYIRLADSLNRALTVYHQYEDIALPTDLAVFADSISVAETMFMNQQTTDISVIGQQMRNLSAAIEAFLASLNTSGITTVRNEATEEKIYNLGGQRLARPAKGVNIISGRKVVIR